MIVALIGATGNVGSRILAELVRRGHEVWALVRHPENVPIHKGVSARQTDVNDLPTLPTKPAVVGGAGSLEIAPGLREVDGPNFPPHVRPEALKGAEFLERLRASDLDWTFLSPSRMYVAVALVDELEQPKHLRRRFAVGY
jgi:uncharacterized protein